MLLFINNYFIRKILVFISYILVLIILFSLNNKGYVELIYFDIISRILSLFYDIHLIKDILVFKLMR